MILNKNLKNIIKCLSKIRVKIIQIVIQNKVDKKKRILVIGIILRKMGTRREFELIIDMSRLL